ncbi:MAG: hypothetical protein HY951_04745 [Bacteroidia bacterium]|nr:hypothetical protein [Bacteroidia bacterium]
MRAKIILGLFLLTLLFGAGKGKDFIVEGMKPLYVDKNTAHLISFNGAQPLNKTGKIYIYGEYVFINEQYKGIHVIDNHDKTNPQNVAFFSIPGNIDLAIKNGFIYADNYNDLVVIDINTLATPVLVKRLPNVYSNITQMYPEDTYGYFECVDTSRGYVTGWIKQTLVNPKCRR